MAGSYTLGADLARDHQKLIELEMIVAEAAGDGSAPGKILFHERADNLALETLLMIDYVIRNADVLGDAAGVVDIVERAAASLHGLRHAFVTGEASLVPELHGQADDGVSLGAKHGRDGGGIYTARHSYGNGLWCWHGEVICSF
jgi:hypothetical protein